MKPGANSVDNLCKLTMQVIPKLGATATFCRAISDIHTLGISH